MSVFVIALIAAAVVAVLAVEISWRLKIDNEEKMKSLDELYWEGFAAALTEYEAKGGKINEVWACKGCGRIGTSSLDLLRQGCEGKPERFIPEDRREDD